MNTAWEFPDNRDNTDGAGIHSVPISVLHNISFTLSPGEEAAKNSFRGEPAALVASAKLNDSLGSAASALWVLPFWFSAVL